MTTFFEALHESVAVARYFEATERALYFSALVRSYEESTPETFR